MKAGKPNKNRVDELLRKYNVFIEKPSEPGVFERVNKREVKEYPDEPTVSPIPYKVISNFNSTQGSGIGVMFENGFGDYTYWGDVYIVLSSVKDSIVFNANSESYVAHSDRMRFTAISNVDCMLLREALNIPEQAVTVNIRTAELADDWIKKPKDKDSSGKHQLARYIDVPLYKGQLGIVVSNDVDFISKVCSITYQDRFLEEGEEPYAHSTIGPGPDGEEVFFIILNPWHTTTTIRLSTIVHEAIHITHMIAERRGIEPSFNNDEAITYLAEWVFKEAFMFFRENTNTRILSISI